jgi:two-component system sensor histidine kinase UhpB
VRLAVGNSGWHVGISLTTAIPILRADGAGLCDPGGMQRLAHPIETGRHALAFLADTGRTWLLLIGAAILPLLLFGGWVGYLAAVQTRNETSRNATLAVDGAVSRIAAELVSQLDLVRTIAASAALDIPDLVAFRSEAERVRADQPLWRTIELALPSGAQVLNLLRPAGENLGPTADLASLQRAVSTRDVVVGGIGPVGIVSGRRLVTLRAPVIRDGTLRFVVSAALMPDGITTLLKEVAKDRGQLASATLLAAIAVAPKGILLGETREGVPVETVYRSLPGSGGWVVAFGIPLATLEGPVQRALLLLAAEGCAGLLLAALLTSLVARDLAQRRADEADRATRSLRASEEALALAVEAADLGVWRWGVDEDGFEGSPRSLSLLGLAAASPGRRKPFLSEATAAVEPNDGGLLMEAVAHCVRERTDLDEEFRVVDGASAPRWLRMTGRPLMGSPGQPLTLQGVVADISGRKRAEAEQLDLLRGMALAQEEERRHIARELHDQVGQTVTGLSLGLKALEADIMKPGVESAILDRLSWLRTLVADIGQDIHRAAVNLRPADLDDFGLASALTALATNLSDRHGIAVDVRVVGIVARLPPEIETVVYRVVQEALTNMMKHAGPCRASVLLEQRASEIKLIVEDSGTGFDATDSKHDGPVRLGLLGIRERLRLVAGTLDVETAPGSGTTLFMQIPLSASQTV